MLCLVFHLKYVFRFTLFLQKLLRLYISSLFKKTANRLQLTRLCMIRLFAERIFQIDLGLSFVLKRSKKRHCRQLLLGARKGNC